MKDEEIQQVAKIFQNLGAEKEQAITMARQLIKRAEQLANKINLQNFDYKLFLKPRFAVHKVS